MPKRVGYLYEKMADKSLIQHVIIEGSKGKRKRRDVKMVMEDVGKYVEETYQLIKNETFVPAEPRKMKIRDKSSGKEREIGIVPFFPDGIVHRLAAEVLKPVFMRGMYAHSCASIPGRGNMHAIKYTKKALRDRKHSKYCAKMDIRHYYPSLKPERTIAALRRKVKDERMLKLVKDIISSGDQEGITIGYYINQWLANFYLEPLDHMICGLPGVYYYVRNMDDMVLIGNNKKLLHKAVRKIQEELEKMGLQLKDEWQVFRIDSRGIDFVGYRFFHDHILLRRRNFLKLARHCRRAIKQIRDGGAISLHSAAGLLSRAGQLKHCSGVNIRAKYIDPVGIRQLKNIVRNHSRRTLHDENGNAAENDRSLRKAGENDQRAIYAACTA